MSTLCAGRTNHHPNPDDNDDDDLVGTATKTTTIGTTGGGTTTTTHQQQHHQHHQSQPQNQHEWETVKENTAPLSRGRPISSLGGGHPKLTTTQQQQHHQRYLEHQLASFVVPVGPPPLPLSSSSSSSSPSRTTTDTTHPQQDPTDHHNNNGDLLQLWVTYLKFLEDEIYPDKSITTSRDLFQLYEQCVHTVIRMIGHTSSSGSGTSTNNGSTHNHHKYQTDRRFVRLCCLYADATDDPLSTFYDLHTTYGMGHPPDATTTEEEEEATAAADASALYFNAWAYTAETLQYFTLTRHIFQTGLRLVGQSSLLLASSSASTSSTSAMSYLQLRYQRFQKRMQRYWRNYQQQQLEDGNDGDEFHLVDPPLNQHQLNQENPHYLQELLQYHQQPHQNQSINPHPTAMRGILHPLSSTVHRQPSSSTGVVSVLLPPPSAQQRRRPSSSQPTATFTNRRSRNSSSHSDNNNSNTDTTSTNGPHHHSQSTSSFAIFSDTAPEPMFPRRADQNKSTRHSQDRPTTTTEAERYKENKSHIPVEKWIESGPLRNTYATTTTNDQNTTAHPPPPQLSSSSRQSNTVVGFAIHVDEECRRQQQEEEKLRLQHMAQHRIGRDDRRTHATTAVPTTASQKSKHVTQPMWQHRLLTHPVSRSEQSFEEARYHQGCYKVKTMSEEASTNLNLLHRRPVVVLPPHDTTNTSINSSTFRDDDERNVFGGTGIVVPSEPTINTQFALRELSFMFASPVLLPTDASSPPKSHSFPTTNPVTSEVDDTKEPFLNRRTVTAGRTPFDVFRDDDVVVTANVPHVSAGPNGFAIFCDGSDTSPMTHRVPQRCDHRIDVSRVEPRGVGHRDCDTASDGWTRVNVPPSFQTTSRDVAVDTADPIRSDGTSGAIRSSPVVCPSHGDTATFPLFLSSALEMYDHQNNNDVHHHYHQERTKEATTNHILESPLAFGDISVIVPNNEGDTGTVPIIRRTNSHSYTYTDVYTRSIKEATTRLKASISPGSFPRRMTLARALSISDRIYDLPTCVLPRPFKQGTVQAGTEFVIDACRAVVDHVVVQTSHDIVVTLREDDGPTGISRLVVKSQSPMECLAWEYHILRTVGDRIPKDERPKSSIPRTISSASPFPRPLSFVVLADGAMFSASVECTAGRNLIDLRRAYDARHEEIPEVLILHYTARMLQSIELLHWHAKVLHCNVKPENWILGSSCAEKGRKMESDLMLMDFGRAIDLTDIHRNSNDHENYWMDQVLTGGAMLEAETCVAMRLGLPWSFDIDTFGICACVHLLMHGTPIDIQPTKDAMGERRWVPRLKIPRHFQIDLWKDMFDTLLNLDDDFGRAIGSRPYNLKRLRKQIEGLLQTGHNDALLDAAFQHQYSVLPL